MCNAFTDFTKDRPEVRELKEKIKRLRKEKRWLIEAWADDVFIDDELTPMEKLKSKILGNMQQALKE